MKMCVYSIKDHKFLFGEPIVSPDDATATRYFGFMINNVRTNGNIMNYAPADFDLFRIGEFDSESGQIKPVWPIEFIVNGSSVIGD